MARTRYDTIKPSSQINLKGNQYPDLMSFPIDKFKFTEISKEYILTEPDIDRFYLVCYREYGVSYFDDIILWLNNIDTIHDVTPGTSIQLPAKKDLDRFIIRNLK